MIKIPKVANDRLKSAIPRFQKILQTALDRDVNEADTVTIISDMLESVFGYDKYNDITREFVISGTYCDLAIRVDKSIDYLIEVKAIGIDLKDNHLRQAVNYAAKEGVTWVVLTNGIIWQIHRVTVDGKVSNELVSQIDFLNFNHRKNEDMQKAFVLCKRGLDKNLIDELYEYQQSVNKYVIGHLLTADPIVAKLRTMLRQINPGVKVDTDGIRDVIEREVLKREITDSDESKEAGKKLQRELNKLAKKKANPAQ